MAVGSYADKFEDQADRTEDMRLSALFDERLDSRPVPAMAEQQFLSALAHLELAVRAFKMAALYAKEGK